MGYRIPSRALLLVLPLGLSCTAQKAGNVALAAPLSGSQNSPGAGASAEANAPAGPVEKVRVKATLEAPGDLLDGLTGVLERWQPGGSLGAGANLRTYLQAMLVSSGFRAELVDSLDLTGTFALDTAYPQPDQPGARPEDFELSALIPAKSGAKIIEGLPAGYEAQPLGNDTWQIVDDGVEVLLRAKAKSVEVGRTVADLDRAQGLLSGRKPNWRLQLDASNIPPDDVDPSGPLGLDDPISRQFARILPELSSLSVLADFGTNRDFRVRATADAPFERLGLDSLGTPMREPSTVAAALPSDAAAALAMPLGDPKLLHDQLRRLVSDLDRVLPPPFDEVAVGVIEGFDHSLDHVDREFVSAAYLSDKGQITLILAAKTKNAGKMREALRQMWSSITTGLSKHSAVVADNPDFRYKVTYKPDGATFSGLKFDSLSITVPKALRDGDSIDDAWVPLYLLSGLHLSPKNPKLEVLSAVNDELTVVAIGAGARRLMGKTARNFGQTRPKSLEGDGGLANAREVSGGCHLCVTAEPYELVRGLLIIGSKEGDTDAQRDGAKKALARLSDVRLPGRIAAGATAKTGHGEAGVVIPSSLLLGNPDKIAKTLELLQSLGSDVAPSAPTKSKTP